MNGRSASGWPPSPAPKVMPGELDSRSCSDEAEVCSMMVCGMMVTARGVSTSGATNSGLTGAGFLTWPLTSMVPRLAGCC